MVFSPDGKYIVHVSGRSGSQQLYIRAIENREAKALAGTEGACRYFRQKQTISNHLL